MARNKLPAIGVDDLNLARLSPRVRRILRRRARRSPDVRAARQGVAALRGQQAAARRGFRRERASIQGATDMAANAIEDTSLKGLQGPYKQQVARTLSTMAAATRQSTPLLVADAKDAFRSDKQAIQTDIINAKIGAKQAFADKLTSLTSAARTDAESAVAARKEDKPSAADEGVRNAMIAVRDALDAWERNDSVEVDGEDVALQSLNPLESQADFRRFAVGLTRGYEGVTLKDAVRAFNLIRSRKGLPSSESSGPLTHGVGDAAGAVANWLR